MAIEPQTPTGTTSVEEVEIKVVSHSQLFYWWPVWAVGFLMAGLTFIDGHRLYPLPRNAEVVRDATIEVPVAANESNSLTNRDAIVFPADARLPEGPPKQLVKETSFRHVASTPIYGVVFCITILLVILITNVPLRGLWSVIVIVTVVLTTIIFIVAGVWGFIIEYLSLLDIRINVGGYVFISVVLFVIWLATMTLFDRQVYMIFTPGQLRVCQEIGGGEKSYDTMGMTVEKKRSDLFRHWILGLGSGDLTVNTSGAQAHHFEMPNVLFIGSKVKLIQDMLREKAIVQGRNT